MLQNQDWETAAADDPARAGLHLDDAGDRPR
jgi:hypothetical protein